MVLKGTFNCLTAVVLKRTDCRQVHWFYYCCCLALADAEEAEAGLTAADVLAGR